MGHERGRTAEAPLDRAPTGQGRVAVNALTPIQGDPIIPRRKLDISEYYRMGEIGILTPEDRVELIEGELIQMAPISPEHSGVVDDFAAMLFGTIGDRARVRIGQPVHLDAHNAPEPDLALVAPRPDGYRQSHPTSADVFLLIEVAQSSLGFDRTAKLRLYAAHGIREYWIVNLPERCIEVCREPQGDSYASITRFAPDSTLEPKALPGLRLRLSDILG